MRPGIYGGVTDCKASWKTLVLVIKNVCDSPFAGQNWIVTKRSLTSSLLKLIVRLGLSNISRLASAITVFTIILHNEGFARRLLASCEGVIKKVDPIKAVHVLLSSCCPLQAMPSVTTVDFPNYSSACY